MNNISRIIIKIILVIIITQFIFAPTCQADSILGDIFSNGDAFLESKAGGEAIDGKNLQKAINNLYNVLFGLGVIITVLVGAVLGIMLVFGTLEDKAKIKEMLIPYVVGCVIIYGAFGIWKLVMTLLASVT